MKLRALGALLITFFALPTTAQVFKCRDAQGQVVFSSFPCSDTAEAVQVEVGSGPGGGDRSSGAPAASTLRSAPRPPAGRRPAGQEPLSAEEHAFYRALAEEQQRDAQAVEAQLRVMEREAQGLAEAPASPSAMYPAQAATPSQACESAERAVETIRARGRRGYGASEARAYRAQLRQAKDQERAACRGR